MLVACRATVADKTVSFRPFAGQSFAITGSEHDAGIVGEIERSGGFYQRDVAALLQHRLGRDAVVVDGGAHIGVLTVLMAGLCPAGHVYAFEPAPQNAAHLEANVTGNGLGNVTVERVALHRDDGELTIAFDDASPGGSHVGAGTDVARVRGIRLDTWARQRELTRLDLMKLDVEGVELAVLDGAEATLRRFRPLLIVECNPVTLRRFGGASYRDLLARLRTLYDVVAVIGEGGTLVPVVSPRHLQLALQDRGVVDLACLAGSVPALDRAKGMAQAAQLLAGHNRLRPSAHDFVVDPSGIELRPEPAQVDGVAGGTVRVAVEVRNGSRSWLSSDWAAQPVHLSYRWFDDTGARLADEGERTRFAAPLGPGRAARLAAAVRLPAEPGKYELSFTLVQEHFTWLDEIDPRCTARLAAAVAAGPPDAR